MEAPTKSGRLNLPLDLDEFPSPTLVHTGPDAILQRCARMSAQHQRTRTNRCFSFAIAAQDEGLVAIIIELRARFAAFS
jgi:hypothetical protein